MDRKTHRYTTKDGFTVEYSSVGQGEPVLIMHGGHSSCNEELGYRELLENGYAIITPSRPGYGNTSKELGEDVITACEAYVELLDNLRLPQIHIIAISAGGPSGIHFASRYPQRVKSLTLQSAVSHRWLTPEDKLYKSAQTMFRPSNEKYLWALMRLMNKLVPSLLFKSMIASFSQLQPEQVLPQISGEDRRQFKNMLNRQRSGHGFLIDLALTGHDLTSVLSAIQCPTLIMHSIHDATVSVEHARHAHRHIPNAELCELDSWGHLIWLGKGAPAMFHKLFTFLDSIK
ncbi:alpha/beta hydrolase [Paenibacillus sp. HWE-109]|uniref:alpha/beta fold hydrolase n=1 Tax=Paenibacillus sp. HWE-109 TaxID=1306526 RepID=UPI001EDEDA27|nr:alpha/beta hydrolase [Paenibacillus sp. HWE-109]UKS25940.1 alpha/beta hydrolase [Paenibacillus sp. HWE-109]